MRSRQNSRLISQLHNNRGLTLVEIMIVLLILAGLLVTVGKQVFDSYNNANVKTTKLRFGEVSKALEMYNADCQSMPTTEQGLSVLMADPGKDVCANWGPSPYLKKQVATDAWGKPFIYESDGTTFVLKSLGKDKKEGGTGVDRDLLSTDGEDK